MKPNKADECKEETVKHAGGLICRLHKRSSSEDVPSSSPRSREAPVMVEVGGADGTGGKGCVLDVFTLPAPAFMLNTFNVEFLDQLGCLMFLTRRLRRKCQ